MNKQTSFFFHLLPVHVGTGNLSVSTTNISIKRMAKAFACRGDLD